MGFTASLSTAVQAMKEAQAARAKKMFWLEMPVSAGWQVRGGRKGQQQQGQRYELKAMPSYVKANNIISAKWGHEL
jgi:hypothetical protein